MKRLLALSWLLVASLAAAAPIIEQKTPPLGSLSSLPVQAPNTVVGNGTGSTAAPTALTQLPVMNGAVGTINLSAYLPATASVRSTTASTGTNYIITTSSSAVVNCAVGCNFVAGDVGKTMIIWAQDNTGNEFQSTILTVNTAQQVTLNAAVTFASTGAAGMVGTDETTYIQTAWNAAQASNKCIYVSAGAYFWNGSTGLSGWASPCIEGDPAGIAYMFIGNGDYFIDGNEFWSICDLNRVQYVGGKGAIRNRWSSTNVDNGPMNFHDGGYSNFTVSGIQFNSSDITYLSIQRNSFYGLSSLNSIGVAIAGADKANISENYFLLSRYALKLGNAGISINISDNDFIQFALEPTPGTYQRAAVWLVPNVTGGNTANSAYAETYRGNKFGPENLDTKDVRFLLADTTASSGSPCTTCFGDTAPLTTLSTGSVSGLVIDETNNFSQFGGSSTSPIIYSYTPNFTNNVIAGTLVPPNPPYIIKFDATVTLQSLQGYKTNRCGPFNSSYNTGGNNAGITITSKISNLYGVCTVVDPNGQYYLSDTSVPNPYIGEMGYDAITVPFVATAQTSAPGFLAGSTSVAITDSTGGTDAIRITTTGTSWRAVYYDNTQVPVAGQQVWGDVYIRQGASGTPITTPVTIAFCDNAFINCASDAVNLTPTANWQHVCVPFTVGGSNMTWGNLQVWQATSVTTQTLDIEFLRVYAASSCAGGGNFLVPVTTPGIVGTKTNNSATVGLVGEYWDTNCTVVTSAASIAFTSATPTVGTWSSPPWAASAGAPFGSYACPFYISATAPTGLSTNTTYWAVPQTASTFKVATTAANAMAGTFAATSGLTTTSTLVSSTYQVATTTVVAVGAMNLTAGDWDCQMSGIFLPAATTSVTNLQAGINSSGTAIGALGSYADFETAANVLTATNNPILVSPNFRESLSATTAEYAVTDATFTASTMTESGDFRCRRVR